MDIEDIKKLIELMESKGVSELEMKDRAGEIRLVRATRRSPAFTPIPGPGLDVPADGVQQDPSPPTGPAPDGTADSGLFITSPMVGTFYSAPGPEAEPFVEAGSVIESGDVVCIIEAMKMMNEIDARARGRITKVLVENGQPIEYGQRLFALEPL